MITLSHKQCRWLDGRNRDERDVFIDEKGMFITMQGWSKDWKDVPVIRRIYLPKK